MVGDGANDLLAIRQADIGIGIRNCDSSYAASFSVEKLEDIDYIIREAKCGQRQIVEIIRSITITSFISVPFLIIMETEGAFYSPFQLIFGNITKYIILNILLALSRPSMNRTVYKSSANFLKFEHQLCFWGNVILGTLGHIAIMIYSRTRSQYIENSSHITTSTGWVSDCTLVSVQHFWYSVHPIILIFGIYQSDPFKLPIYKNVLLFVVLLINIAFIAAHFSLYHYLL